MKKTLLFILLSCGFSFLVKAQIPNVIPYQGQITDTSGVGFNGKFDFSFRILDNNGTALWSSNTVNLEVFKGSYSVNLGQSPQPLLPANLVSNDLMFLEISFDDGKIGKETLSPNVQILPVPYALRAVIADSAVSSNGQLAWGDSLVLKDAGGDIRFVINPNTGEFRAMQKDTTWYKLQVNSPPKISKKKKDGAYTEETVEMNGKSYSKLTYESKGYRAENFIQHSRDLGNTDTVEITRVYGPNDCLRSEKFLVYVVSRGTTKEVTITYNCPAGTVKGIKQELIDGPDEEGDEVENKKTSTKTIKKTKDGSLHAATVDTRTGNVVAATFSPKDSCFIINADKFILENDSTRYVIRLNKNGTISTEAIKVSTGIPFPKLMQVLDPLTGGIQNFLPQEMLYEYLEEDLVMKYRQEGVSEEIIEAMNAAAKKKVTRGINTLERYVDSFFKHRIYSQNVLDSIRILWSAVGHFVEYRGVEEFRQLNDKVKFVRFLDDSKKQVKSTYKDESTNTEIEETIDLDAKKDILKGAEGNDFIYGGDDFTTTYKIDGGTDSISKIYNAGTSSIKTKGALIRTDQIVGGDTFTSSVVEVTVGDVILATSSERLIPQDSMLIIDGTTKVNRKVGSSTATFVYEGNTGSTFLVQDPNQRLVIQGGIKRAEWNFDSAIAALSGDGTQFGLNYTKPGTGNSVGIGFDPDGRTVIVEGNGKVTFIGGDTIVAQDKILSNGLDISGNAVFGGNVNIGGLISKGGGSFKIDHPDDPYNKYLYHSFMESPDMMNVYNGNTTTDTFGFDTVVMPAYFKNLNRDFRYQLTCIGTFAQAIIIKELENNQFVIQTNKPNVKVSWQITGIRKDDFANENRIEIEVEKKGNEKGTLLYPPKVQN